MEGGFFLLHHIESRSPDAFKALEIIGLDPSSGKFSMSYFDSKGQTVASTVELNGRELRIASKAARFAGAFNENGSALSGTWEKSDDGLNWHPSMDITLTKVIPEDRSSSGN